MKTATELKAAALTQAREMLACTEADLKRADANGRVHDQWYLDRVIDAQRWRTKLALMEAAK